MELFTFGVGNYTEQDVYAAARVFTGWNLRRVGSATTTIRPPSTSSSTTPNQHETAAKTFTFPIYARRRPHDSGARRRRGHAGRHRLRDRGWRGTRRRRAASLRKLWNFFVSDLTPPTTAFVQNVASVYLRNDTEMRPVLRYILRSQWFVDRGSYYARYSWPAEFVVRAIKEVGWNGFSVDTARTPLTNMGQTLFEPPDVNGWDLGRGWFSTGSMLARMNFAVAARLEPALQPGARRRRLPRLAREADGLFPGPLSRRRRSTPTRPASCSRICAPAATWTGTDAQVTARAAGLARLIVGSSEYQFV